MILKNGNVERVAETEAQVEKLKASGYKELNAIEEAEKNEQKPLDSMKVDELKKLAKECGIEGAASLNKAELLEVLKDVV